MKAHFSTLVAGRRDAELLETFFNSASRRIFHTVGVDDRAEFVTPEPAPLPDEPAGRFLASWNGRHGREAAIRSALGAFPFAAGWEDLGRDAALATRALDGILSGRGARPTSTRSSSSGPSSTGARAPTSWAASAGATGGARSSSPS